MLRVVLILHILYNFILGRFNVEIRFNSFVYSFKKLFYFIHCDHIVFIDEQIVIMFWVIISYYLIHLNNTGHYFLIHMRDYINSAFLVGMFMHFINFLNKYQKWIGFVLFQNHKMWYRKWDFFFIIHNITI